MLDSDDNLSPSREEIKQAIESMSAFTNPLVGRTRSTMCVMTSTTTTTSRGSTTSTTSTTADSELPELSENMQIKVNSDDSNAPIQLKDGFKTLTSLLKTKMGSARPSQTTEDDSPKVQVLQSNTFDQLQSKAFSAMLMNVLSEYQN